MIKKILFISFCILSVSCTKARREEIVFNRAIDIYCSDRVSEESRNKAKEAIRKRMPDYPVAGICDVVILNEGVD